MYLATVHSRSFFTAYSLARLPPKSVGEILARISQRRSDDVIAMLFDMNDELVESEYIVPRLHALNEEMRAENGSEILRYLYVMGIEFELTPQDDQRPIAGLRVGRWYTFVTLLGRIYGTRQTFWFTPNMFEDTDALLQLKRKLISHTTVDDPEKLNVRLEVVRTSDGLCLCGVLSKFFEERIGAHLPIEWDLTAESNLGTACEKDLKELERLEIDIERKRQRKAEALAGILGPLKKDA